MQVRVVIFGNSGSGKSTLARTVAATWKVPHLDLDTVAWGESETPTRQALDVSQAAIERFTAEHDSWVVEGCYADLLPFAIAQARQVIFLDPGTDACVANCRARPWEPHKYASKELQDARLPMLEDWVRSYPTRDDEYARSRHLKLLETFPGCSLHARSNDHDALDWLQTVSA